MKCHVCGAALQPIITDLPFKIGDHSIVIIKDLPVLQCEACHEFLMEDSIMKRVEELLAQTSSAAELEVIRFAA